MISHPDVVSLSGAPRLPADADDADGRRYGDRTVTWGGAMDRFGSYRQKRRGGCAGNEEDDDDGDEVNGDEVNGEVLQWRGDAERCGAYLGAL